ncbi:putative alkylglycerol monooxygenase-like [Penaeus vannamei]|uniref:Alkylglycerol monooxygenase n=1 Tax=Penaeus vannamei TaxID=6689 RepID=A0A3R7MMC7_PENVA|nr:putative alkylglycerol monooxygenase-like [Penaeus vannamei]
MNPPCFSTHPLNHPPSTESSTHPLNHPPIPPFHPSLNHPSIHSHPHESSTIHIIHHPLNHPPIHIHMFHPPIHSTTHPVPASSPKRRSWSATSGCTSTACSTWSGTRQSAGAGRARVLDGISSTTGSIALITVGGLQVDYRWITGGFGICDVRMYSYFVYYWVHRANHEINLLWAAHQVHHSSEDYTLPTGLRLSMFQRLTYFGFYQPLALLGLPVTSVMVHLGLNYLFQFWVHNEAVRKMGPLEWVFNTPSHHRVHHGANKWCLDKNYGSLLIVWDRLFGTFQEERDDEEIVYGLVEQPQFLNGVWHELFYLEKIYEKARGMSSWSDSLRAVFYGPGWVPGAPRLGDPDAFPDVKAPRAKYDPQMPVWFMVYTALHFTLAFGAQQIMLVHLKVSPWHTAALFLAFILLTMGVLGSMFDGWRWAPLLEAARCAAFLLYSRATPITSSPQLDAALYFLFSMSTFFWTVLSLRTLRAPLKIVKED